MCEAVAFRIHDTFQMHYKFFPVDHIFLYAHGQPIVFHVPWYIEPEEKYIHLHIEY